MDKISRVFGNMSWLVLLGKMIRKCYRLILNWDLKISEVNYMKSILGRENIMYEFFEEG